MFSAGENAKFMLRGSPSQEHCLELSDGQTHVFTGYIWWDSSFINKEYAPWL